MLKEYIYTKPLPINEYQKVAVTHLKCGCDDFLCVAGMNRGVKCKKCFGRKKGVRPIKDQHKIPITLPNNYWGTVYYIKIGDVWKIGVSQHTVTGRFSLQTDYIPIWEIPCKTKSEALGIECLILTVYENDLCVTQDPTFQLPHSGGRRECFVRDVLGNQFNIDKFINKLELAFFRLK